MSLEDRINECLEHYDYALVGVNIDSSDNVVGVPSTTTNLQLFRFLTIAFGSKRISKQQNKVRVDR